MRHPISRLAAAVIFILAIGGITLWFHGGGTTLAFADFIQPILEAKTVKFKMTGESEGQQMMTAEVMVLATPSRIRMEQELPNRSRMVTIMDGETGESFALIPAQKQAIVHSYTNMRRLPKNIFLDLRSQLIEARDRPDFRREPLGEKEIDGRRVVGCRLTGHGLAVSLWGDPKTGLPIRMELTSPAFPAMKEVVMSDFVFDADLDKSLFSMEPPAGYKVETIKVDGSPAEEKDLVETFRRYSQLNGGVFPDTLDLAAMMRFSEEHFEKARPKRQEKLSEQQRQEENQEHRDQMRKLTRGLAFVFEELPPEADTHYAGKGVSFGAADTPIFWYRPKDAKQYRLIYADLSVREADTPPAVPNAQPVPSAAGPQQ